MIGSHKEKGFTVVEMLVGIILTALLTTVVFYFSFC